MLHYKTLGHSSQPCLIIIHGLFGSLDNWQSIAKKWSENYWVVSIDVRNHGKSFHSDIMSFEAMAQDILNLCNEINVEKCHLIGHSMGGKIAMEFASRYPERLASVIFVDIAPYSYSPHHSDVFDMIKALNLKHYTTRNEIEEEVRKYLKNDVVVQFMMKNIRRNEPELFFEWKFNAKVLDRDYLPLIQYIPPKGYVGSTLFIGGEQSTYISKETAANIFDLYPGAELDYVSNAGHWVQADNPKEFYHKVNTFLNKTTPQNS